MSRAFYSYADGSGAGRGGLRQPGSSPPCSLRARGRRGPWRLVTGCAGASPRWWTRRRRRALPGGGAAELAQGRFPPAWRACPAGGRECAVLFSCGGHLADMLTRARRGELPSHARRGSMSPQRPSRAGRALFRQAPPGRRSGRTPVCEYAGAGCWRRAARCARARRCCWDDAIFGPVYKKRV